MEQSVDHSRDLLLLEQIETDPDVTQASMAGQLGIAVGTVNWHLKRLVSKGYVKVTRARRRRLRYIITPQGISLRARLTVEYVERSMQLYRKTRRRVATLLKDVRSAGYTSVRIEKVPGSPSDILDICRLTCLEHGIAVAKNGAPVPALRVIGRKVQLELEGEHELAS